MQKITLNLIVSKINERKHAERIGILIGLLLLVAIFWKLIIFNFISSMSDHLSKKNITVQQAIVKHLEEKTLINNKISNVETGDFALKAKEMKGKVSKLKKNINVDKITVVLEKDITDIYHKVSTLAKDLDVITFTWGEPKNYKYEIKKVDKNGNIIEDNSEKTATETENIYNPFPNGIDIYNFTLLFTADYKATSEFIKKVEQLKWHLWVETFFYSTDTELYPDGSVLVRFSFITVKESNDEK